MNTENIIKMAQEAGLHSVELLDLYGGNVKDSELDKLRRLERFAALVAAAEREAIAEYVEEIAVQHPKHIAAAIRARGNP